MKQLILFDIDGTLLSMQSNVSKKLFINSFEEVFGKSINEEFLPVFNGNTDLGILFSIAEKINLKKDHIIEKIDSFWEVKLSYFKDFCTSEYVSVLPGVNKLLQYAQSNEDISLGLLTGNARKNAYQKLSAVELNSYFNFGAFGCDNENRRLLPPIALQRAKDYTYYDYGYLNTIIVGDTISDIDCAKYNNIKVMAVLTGGGDSKQFKSYNADSIVNDFSDTEFIIDEFQRLFKTSL